MSHLSLDARAILEYLNELGYRNISANQLKEFMKGMQPQSENNSSSSKSKHKAKSNNTNQQQQQQQDTKTNQQKPQQAPTTATIRPAVKVIKCKRPLQNFKFYLDVCEHLLTRKIEEQIKALGGSLDFFLTPNVTHFITDKKTALTPATATATTNNNNTLSRPGTPQTPATANTPGTPLTPYSPYETGGNYDVKGSNNNNNNNGGGTPGATQRRTRQSRADAILNRARRQSTTTNNTTTAAATAAATNDDPQQSRRQAPAAIAVATVGDAAQTYIVWQTEYALRFFRKVQHELKDYLQPADANVTTTTTSAQQPQQQQQQQQQPQHHHHHHHQRKLTATGSKSAGGGGGEATQLNLKGGFIKIEALKHNYRPYYQLFKKPNSEWPKIELQRDDGAFRLSPKKAIAATTTTTATTAPTIIGDGVGEDCKKQTAQHPAQQTMTRKSRSRSSQRAATATAHPPLSVATVQALKRGEAPAKSGSAVGGVQQQQQHKSNLGVVGGAAAAAAAACKQAKESSDKQCGVCEICKIEYDTLTIHLKTKDHEYFARNSQNFIALDTLIQASADVNKFLEADKQQLKIKHEATEEDEADDTELLNDEEPEQEDDGDDDMEVDVSATATAALAETTRKTRRRSSGVLSGGGASAQKTPSPTALREKSKRSTKGKHSSEKFQRSSPGKATAAAKASLSTSSKTPPKTPSAPKKHNVSALEQLQRLDTAAVASLPPNTRKKPATTTAALSPPIRAMLPPSSLYKVVETPEQRTPTRKARDTGEAAVVASPSLIVKFKKVRHTEVVRLNGEAEQFMFPKRRTSSELPTDVDRQTTSDNAHVGVSSASLDSSSSSSSNSDCLMDVETVNALPTTTALLTASTGVATAAATTLNKKAIAVAKRRKGAPPAEPSGGAATSLAAQASGKQSFPNAPIQPEIQLKRLRQPAATASAATTTITTATTPMANGNASALLPEATRKSSRTATAIVTAATTSSRLLRAAVEAAKQQQCGSRRGSAAQLSGNASETTVKVTATSNTATPPVAAVLRALKRRCRVSVVQLEDRMGDVDEPNTYESEEEAQSEQRSDDDGEQDEEAAHNVNELDDDSDENDDDDDDDDDVDDDDAADEDYMGGGGRKRRSYKQTTPRRAPAAASIANGNASGEKRTSTRAQRAKRRYTRLTGIADGGDGASGDLDDDDDDEGAATAAEDEDDDSDVAAKAPMFTQRRAVRGRAAKAQQAGGRAKRQRLGKSATAPAKSKRQQRGAAAASRKPQSPPRVLDLNKTLRLQKQRYAFERQPAADLWYRVFTRQDACEERYFTYYGATAYRQLPYELGPLPYERAGVTDACCQLCQRQRIKEEVKAERVDGTTMTTGAAAVVVKKEPTLQEEHNYYVDMAAAGRQDAACGIGDDSNSEAATPSSSAAAAKYAHKHKKLHLLQRYRQEQQQELLKQQQQNHQHRQQQQQQPQSQTTLANNKQAEQQQQQQQRLGYLDGLGRAIVAAALTKCVGSARGGGGGGASEHSKASTPERERERERAGSTHSNTSSCASSSATLSRHKHYRSKLLSLELAPRKSPREHASTLALVSIIKQRQDSQSKPNSETDEPPTTPTPHTPPVAATTTTTTTTTTTRQQQPAQTPFAAGNAPRSAMARPAPLKMPPNVGAAATDCTPPAVLRSPRNMRSAAATPIEELRFATEISETVKRMRRGQNKYDHSPPLAQSVSRGTRGGRAAQHLLAATSALDATVLKQQGRSNGNVTTTTTTTTLVTEKRRYKRKALLLNGASGNGKAKPTPAALRQSFSSSLAALMTQPQGAVGLPGGGVIRKTGSKKGVCEFEMDAAALRALDAATTAQHTDVRRLEWEIDKFLTLAGGEYDMEAGELHAGDCMDVTTDAAAAAATSTTATMASTAQTIRSPRTAAASAVAEASQPVAKVLANRVSDANTPPPTDYFSSDFDLYDLFNNVNASSSAMNGSGGAGVGGSGCGARGNGGSDDDQSRTDGGSRRKAAAAVAPFSLYNSIALQNYFRRRKTLKSNRTGWPKVQKKKISLRQQHLLQQKIRFLRDLEGGNGGVVGAAGTSNQQPLEHIVAQQLKQEQTAGEKCGVGLQSAAQHEGAAAAAAVGRGTKERRRANGGAEVITPPDSDAEEERMAGEKAKRLDAQVCDEDDTEMEAAAVESNAEDEQDETDSLAEAEAEADEVVLTGEDLEAEADEEEEEEDDDDEYELCRDEFNAADEAAVEADDDEDDDDDDDDEEREYVQHLHKRSRRATHRPAAVSPIEKLHNSHRHTPSAGRLSASATTAMATTMLTTTAASAHKTATSTPTVQMLRGLRRTPQLLNGSLGSCISPSEKAGDNSDIFTVSSDGLDTDLDMSNSHTQARGGGAADDDEPHHLNNLHLHHDHCAQTPKRKFDLSKYAPKSTTSCAAEAATAAVKSLAISQFLKKEVRVTCRRLRAPFRRFRYRR